MDAKLDRLLKQRKVEVAAGRGGIVFAIEEAEVIEQETGHVSDITWSKVQGNSRDLQTIQAECVGQINALADELKACGNDVDKTATAWHSPATLASK